MLQAVLLLTDIVIYTIHLKAPHFEINVCFCLVRNYPWNYCSQWSVSWGWSFHLCRPQWATHKIHKILVLRISLGLLRLFCPYNYLRWGGLLTNLFWICMEVGLCKLPLKQFIKQCWKNNIKLSYLNQKYRRAGITKWGSWYLLNKRFFCFFGTLCLCKNNSLNMEQNYLVQLPKAPRRGGTFLPCKCVCLGK